MKLYATMTSERGKEVSKGGNDFVQIQIQGEDRKIFGSVHIYATKDKYVYASFHGKKISASFIPEGLEACWCGSKMVHTHE